MVRPVLKKFKTVLDPRCQGGRRILTLQQNAICGVNLTISALLCASCGKYQRKFHSRRQNLTDPPIYVSQLIQMWKGNILDDSFFRNLSLPRQNLILVLRKRKMRRSFKVTFKQIQKHKWQGRKDMKQEQSTAKNPAGLLFCTFLICLFLRQSPNLGQQVTIFCTLLKQLPRLILHAYISL